MSLYSATNLRAGLRDFLLGRLAAAVLGFIANILIVRVMTEDAYADYATLTGLQLTILLLLSFGIERVMTRFAGEGVMRWSRQELEKMIGGGLVLRAVTIILLALAIIPFSDGLANLINVSRWNEVAPAFWTYTLFFGLFEILQAIAQSFMLQKAIRLSLILQWGLRVLGVAAYVSLSMPLGLPEVLWIFAATSIVPSLVLVPAILTVIASRPRQGSDTHGKGVFSTVVAFGWHNHLEKLASLPSSGAFMRLLAAHTLPSVATASYGFYQTLWGVFHRHMPITISRGMLEAAIAGRYTEREKIQEIGVVTSAIFKINLLMIAPLVAWLTVSGSDIVILLTGGKYADQAWILALITSGLIPTGLWQLLIAHANAVSMSHVLPRAAFWSSLAVIPLAWGVIVFPAYGLFLLGCAVPVFGLLQAGLAMSSLCAQELPFHIERRGVMVLLLAAVFSALLTMLTLNLIGINNVVLRTLSAGSMVGGIFVLFIYMFKIFENEEFVLLDKLHHKIAQRIFWLCQVEKI